MKTFSILLLLLISCHAPAQFLEKKEKRSFDPSGSVSITNDFNAKDWYTGLALGVEDRGYEWGARLGFCFRPFYKKTQVFQENIVRQYREQKYFLSLDLDKRFVHFDVGIDGQIQFFAGVKAGFLFSNYRGTKNDASTFGLIAPLGGVCYSFDDTFFVKAGYCLFNDRVREVPDNRISLTLLYAI